MDKMSAKDKLERAIYVLEQAVEDLNANQIYDPVYYREELQLLKDKSNEIN